MRIRSVYAAHKRSLEVFFSQSVTSFDDNGLWQHLPDGTAMVGGNSRSISNRRRTISRQDLSLHH